MPRFPSRCCKLLVTAALGLFLQSCSPETAESEAQASAPPSQSPFVKTIFREGEAFGDWPLQKTTYQQVMAQLGPQAQVSKSEVAETSCTPYPDCHEEKYTNVRVYQDAFTFYFEHLKPGRTLAELRLEAVRVECTGGCAFQGLTGKGIRIGDALAKVQQVYGNEMQKSETWQASCYRSGICFEFNTRGETPQVVSLLVVAADKLAMQ